MSKIYLENFDSDPDVFLHLPQHHPEGEAGYETDKALIDAIEQERARFAPMTLQIGDALKKAKPVFGDPPSPCTFWVLSKAPKPEPYFKPAPPYLYVDVNYASEKLLKLERDKSVIGALGIRLVEEALSKLNSVPGFPVSVIRDACEEFRGNDYTYFLKSGEAMIPGTKIKGRIDLEFSGSGTKRIFTGSYRNKVLIKQQISEIDWPELTISTGFNGFALDGDAIHVLPNKFHFKARTPSRQIPDGSVRIDLQNFPEALELMNAKGWMRN